MSNGGKGCLWADNCFLEITIEMIYNLFIKKLICLTVLLCLAGCKSPAEYRSEADETVYNIIDDKWQDDFGSKVNYKISDTAPLDSDIKVEKIIPDSGILTLPHAVAIATAHNRSYQTERELLYIKALDLRLARHDFDPQFFGGAAGGYVKYGDDEAIVTQANLGFNQLLACGARISTNVTVAWTEILTGNMRSGLHSIVSATITQPLLRGSDSRIVLENLTQAERDTIYQIRSFNRFRQTLAVSIISQYYRVLEQFEQVKNAENNYKTLMLVDERAQKLARAGRLPRFELNEVRQDRLRAWDTFLQEQKEYKQLLDEFKIAMSLPVTAAFELDKTELSGLSITNMGRYESLDAPKEGESATEELNFPQEEFELIALIKENDGQGNTSGNGEEAEMLRQQRINKFKISSNLSVQADFSEPDTIETALALRLDLANQADGIADAQRKVMVAADNLRAELNLVADTDMSTRGSSDSAASLGLVMDFPLERMAQANQYRRALILLTQQKRAYDEAVDNISLQVRQAYRDFVEAAERYKVQAEGLTLAENRFKNTFLLLQYGRANTRDVLDAQEDLFDAQNAAINTLVDHRIAMLEFYRDAGVLQIRPDGMWEY